jgi:hypothetical protein
VGVHVTVDLTSDPPAVALLAPDDCTRFDVVVSGKGEDKDLDRALVGASIGRTDQKEALVSVVAIRRLASGSVGDGWGEDFTAMLEYARGRGWLTGDDRSIRAHVVWQ